MRCDFIPWQNQFHAIPIHAEALSDGLTHNVLNPVLRPNIAPAAEVQMAGVLHGFSEHQRDPASDFDSSEE